MKLTVNVKGLDETLEKLKKLQDTEPIERALDEAAALVEASAIKRAPRDSGEMASKMYVEKPGPLRRIVGNPTKQAVFTEYSQRILRGASPENPRQGPWPYHDDGKTKGTKASASMPWLRTALRENRERILQLVRDARRGTKR